MSEQSKAAMGEGTADNPINVKENQVGDEEANDEANAGLDRAVEIVQEGAKVFVKAAKYLKSRSPGDFESMKPYMEHAYVAALQKGISEQTGYKFGNAKKEHSNFVLVQEKQKEPEEPSEEETDRDVD